MVDKDIILLGFLYEATKYIKMKSTDDTCKNYDDINQEVEKLYKENSKDDIKYFHAGEKVFERYLSEKRDNNVDEFVDLFNDDDSELKEIQEMVDIYKEMPKIDEDIDEEELLKQISIAANNNINMMNEVRSSTNVKELDRVFNEIVDYEKENKTAENEESIENNDEEIAEDKDEIEEDIIQTKSIDRNDQYLFELMNELSSSKLNQINNENAVKKIKAYESISKTYPYLQGSFIRNVYAAKDGISHDYKSGQPIILLHRIIFKEVDNLRRFVEIVTNHDYIVNVDENKMIVDVLKSFINEDGKILTDIFDISNQACVLFGEYEGFKVFEKDELEQIY